MSEGTKEWLLDYGPIKNTLNLIPPCCSARRRKIELKRSPARFKVGSICRTKRGRPRIDVVPYGDEPRVQQQVVPLSERWHSGGARTRGVERCAALCGIANCLGLRVERDILCVIMYAQMSHKHAVNSCACRLIGSNLLPVETVEEAPAPTPVGSYPATVPCPGLGAAWTDRPPL
jgi:hypothetical protein